MTTITTRKLDSTQPKSSPYFIRDNRVKEFAVKVNTSGSMMFIAEVWHEGKSIRKTLGEYPIPLFACTARVLSFSGNSNLKVPEDQKSIMKSVTLSGK